MPHNAPGWLALVTAGIPVMLGFEWLAEWSRASGPICYIDKWPTAAKIPALVLLFLLFIAAMAPLIWLVHRLIAS